jgi:hypothetical protein
MKRRLVIEFDGSSDGFGPGLGSSASGIVVSPVFRIVSLACGICLLMLAGITPSLFEGVARRLPLSYRRGHTLAKPPPAVSGCG